MTIEGCYIYQCDKCYLKFALVARLSNPVDYFEQATCPVCNTAAQNVGEGSLKQERYREQSDKQEFPEMLTVKDVMDVLKISQGKAYELMSLKDFPVIRIGRIKRVFRKDLMEWIDKQGEES